MVVVPRSLVFNWIAEAAKFTPAAPRARLHRPEPPRPRDEFRDHDLIITTYGTLRTDIAELTQIEFDYVILDEAQAIKNADSQAAKAARLLQGRAPPGHERHARSRTTWASSGRSSSSSTPACSAPPRSSSGTPPAAAAADDEDRLLLAQALRPFILRRTKAQVVKDLPEKSEQTLHCDMEPRSGKLYEELRAHYRTALLAQGRPPS